MSATVRQRTATLVVAAAAAATEPVVDPARFRTTPPAVPPVLPSRSATEIRTDHARAIGEADQLQARSRTAALTAEEQTRLVQLVDTAETLGTELDRVVMAERLEAQRMRAVAPARQAIGPTIIVAPVRANDSEEDGLRTWLRSFGGSTSAEEVYRARTAGFDVGRNSVDLRVDWQLNARRRAISKGANPGLSLVPITYSDKVTEYVTYYSPLLGMVDSETTADGNDRTYFIVDDTAMISTYAAAGGSELVPVIPDTDPALTSKLIKTRLLTSGYHKITREALRDTAIPVTDKLAKAIGNSHARKIERDMILGNGTTEAEGIVTNGTIFGAVVADLSDSLLDDLFFSVAEPYRTGSIFLAHNTTVARLRKRLKDSTGRTLLSDAVEGDRRILRYGGLEIVASDFMPAYAANAKVLTIVNPMFYMLRMVAGQTIDVLAEKFHPHLAYSGMMSFGGGYLGPASTNKFIQLSAVPTP